MSKRPAIHRVDANQAAIVAALLRVGATVQDLSGVGGGCPDLLVGYRGVNYLLEVKNPDGRGLRLTPAEKEFQDFWRGQSEIVTSVDGALAVIDPYICPCGEKHCLAPGKPNDWIPGDTAEPGEHDYFISVQEIACNKPPTGDSDTPGDGGEVV